MIKKIIQVGMLSCLAWSADSFNIIDGWGMYGSSNNISIETFKNESVKSVWSYDKYEGKWKFYSPSEQLQNIAKSSGYKTIETIDKNEGFWINGNYNNIILNNLSTAISYNDMLVPIDKSLFANKTYNYYPGTFSNDIQTLSFDSLASTFINLDTTNVGHSNLGDNELGNIIPLNISIDNNGSLNFALDNGITTHQYQLLGTTDGAILVGITDIDNFTFNKYIPEAIFPLFEEDFQENPIDMSTKIPYTSYRLMGGISPDDYHYIYETNGTVTTSSKILVEENGEWIPTGEYLIQNDGNYTIDENGAILTEYYSDYDSGGNDTSLSRQIIASFGNFDLHKVVYGGYSWYKSIDFQDVNSQYQTVNLAESNVTTWQELFAITGNKYQERTFNNDGTITDIYYDGDETLTYQIINDGKTLVRNYPNNNWSDATITDNIIYNAPFEYTSYEIVSTVSLNK